MTARRGDAKRGLSPTTEEEGQRQDGGRGNKATRRWYIATTNALKALSVMGANEMGQGNKVGTASLVDIDKARRQQWGTIYPSA